MRILPFVALSAVLALSGCNRSPETAAQLEAMQASADAAAAENLKAGQAYLTDVSKQPGVVRLPSGVLYKIVSQAKAPGAQPKLSDTVTINYEGKLINGKVFDSSYARNQPASFPLTRLITAWQQVIPLMHVGDEIMLYTPSSSGYGEADSEEIPSNSALIFRIQLLGIGGK